MPTVNHCPVPSRFFKPSFHKRLSNRYNLISGPPATPRVSPRRPEDVTLLLKNSPPMSRPINALRLGILAASLAGLVAPSARADVVLAQYEFQGQKGDETTLAPSFVAAGLSGQNVAESAGLAPLATNNAINSTGWNNAGVY